MTTLTRWKLSCAVLAAVAGGAMIYGCHGRAAHNAPAKAATAPRGSLPLALRRPIHVSADALGVSQKELVDRILAAKSVKDIQLLADKLAVVGDDDAVETLAPLIEDPRSGVPATMLAMFGQIGTQRAVEIIAQHANDERPLIRTAAIAALGATHSEKAEKVLIELSRKNGDPSQTSVITALGTLGSDNAVARLIEVANTGDASLAVHAVNALGNAGTQASKTALRTLIDAPNPHVAAAALSSIENVDDALLEKLKVIVKTGQPQLGASAVAALGHAGEVALPVLREAALNGTEYVRWSAIAAIGEVGGDKAVAILGDVLKTGDRQSAIAASQVLANLGGAEAREILIEAALSDRGGSNGALVQLAQMQGEDVDQAMLSVIKQGSSNERRAVLPRLVKAGNPEAMQLAIDLAKKGSRNEKYDAMRILGEANTPKAVEALLDIAGKARGQTRIQALELIAQNHPTDPAVGQLLSDSLFSGRNDEATSAANVMSRLGTEDARHALVAALTGKDKQLAAVAASALGQVGMTENVKVAMLNAARDNPQVKLTVMQQLVEAGAPEGMKLAEEIIASKDGVENASQVVWALASRGTADAKRLLERAIDSKEPNVRMAAITSLAQDPDEHSTDTLLRLVRDSDPQVRATALSTLGQVGSERAQTALLDATRGGKTEERVAAISGLAQMEDPRASQQLAHLMRDSDPEVVRAAISSSYNAGPEVDQTLTQLVNDGSISDEVKLAAAAQLRARGADLDDRTEQIVTKLAGMGGAGYGGYAGHDID